MGQRRRLPLLQPETNRPSTEYGAEWSARLEPIERTAAFAFIDFDGQHETMTAPETGTPVVRQANGLLLSAIPQRLATFSPLAAVILDSPIWVRTEDGTLYPALKGKHYGLSWAATPVPGKDRWRCWSLGCWTTLTPAVLIASPVRPYAEE